MGDILDNSDAYHWEIEINGRVLGNINLHDITQSSADLNRSALDDHRSIARRRCNSGAGWRVYSCAMSGAIPTVGEAHTLLLTAARRNPGPWVQHLKVAASAARAIAKRHPSLDPDRAYVLALLHDVGRGSGGNGVADVQHILDGYHSMLEHGFDGCARVCLTHSFPIKHTAAYAGRWECPPQDQQFVQHYLDSTEYDDYDRLVQLCDALALPSGVSLIEMRLVDVRLRHGFNSMTQAKWRAVLQLERDFSAALGTSIYHVLPGVVESTFGFAAPL
jgi:HD domain